MNKIILEVLQNNDDTSISVESLTIISLYAFLQYSPNIQLQFSKTVSPTVNGYLKIKSKFSTFNKTCLRRDSSTKSLRPPIFINDNMRISGLCAVARKLVLQSKYAKHQNLLGFKNSCLQAPTEASLWTRFCEIEIVDAVYSIIKHKFMKDEEFIVPNVFGKFENHLNQPVRMHNIFKISRETEKNNILQHKFAEGIYFTVADILLYINFYLIFEYLPNPHKLYLNLPLLTEWLKTITTHSLILNDILKEIILLCEKNDYSNNFEISFKLKDEEQHSLYKSDPKRYKPKSRMFTIQDNIYENLEKFKKLNISINSKNEILTKKQFYWANISEKAHLEYGNIPESRLLRKKQQIQSMIDVIYSIAKDNDVIVDFCSGTGHLGIILACILPKCTIIFLENKPFSIEKTQQRAIDLNLENCVFYQSNIDYFYGNFNIGVSLHACGTATDIVLTKCILKKANFICCPCCYGSISPMPHIKYPLSNAFRIGLTEKEYLYLAHAADQTQFIENYNFNATKNLQGEFCMDVIDMDRKSYANEYKYNVILTTLKPANCTLKNRLLIGSLVNFTDEIQIINSQER